MTPTVFISYSWDSEEHKKWVLTLADRLEEDGVTVTIDDRDFALGDQIPKSMEHGISQNDFVLFICTPRFADRSDKREGGVGYESNIMTAEIAKEGNDRKFIPIWRSGDDWKEAAPSWAYGKKYVDLRGDSYNKDEYANLLRHLRNERYATSAVEHQEAPPLDTETVRDADRDDKATEDREQQRHLTGVTVAKSLNHVTVHRQWLAWALVMFFVGATIALVIILTPTGENDDITPGERSPQTEAQKAESINDREDAAEESGAVGEEGGAEQASPVVQPMSVEEQEESGEPAVQEEVVEQEESADQEEVAEQEEPAESTEPEKVVEPTEPGDGGQPESENGQQSEPDSMPMPGRQVIAAGERHTCAVAADNTVQCWGDNGHEQRPPPEMKFTQVSAGLWYTCGITIDQEVWCSDVDTFDGELPPEGRFTQVSAGNYKDVPAVHACALRADEVLVCWGEDQSGQASPPSNARFRQVSAGATHTCAVTKDDEVLCWGSDVEGESTFPTGIRFSQVAAGWFYSCGLTTEGVVQCWGSDEGGKSSPPGDDRFIQISVGASHACGVTTDSYFRCWGSQGPVNKLPLFKGVRFVQVNAGFVHTCGVTTDNRVLCWGDNPYGQTSPPPEIELLSPFPHSER